MLGFLTDLLLLPFKVVFWLIALLGRGLVIIIGLCLFGVGIFLTFLGPLIIIGAPMCLLGFLMVVEAF